MYSCNCSYSDLDLTYVYEDNANIVEPALLSGNYDLLCVYINTNSSLVV